MTSNSNESLTLKIQKLSQLLLKQDEIPRDILHNLTRLLRPNGSGRRENEIGIYSTAIRKKIRQKILENYRRDDYKREKEDKKDGDSLKRGENWRERDQGSDNGLIQLSYFDSEVDELRKQRSQHLESFLILLEPLAFSNQWNEQVYFTTPTATRTEKSARSNEKKIESKNIDSKLPIGIPPPLNEEELTLLNDQTLWISKDIELLILRDLLLVFQVRFASKFYLTSNRALMESTSNWMREANLIS
jgi:hypothetical protein